MKKAAVAIGILCLGLCACASMTAGNPNADAYFGTPGSTYDAKANPARNIGTVAYDPTAALPGTIPATRTSGSTMPDPQNQSP